MRQDNDRGFSIKGSMRDLILFLSFLLSAAAGLHFQGNLNDNRDALARCEQKQKELMERIQALEDKLAQNNSDVKFSEGK